MQGGLGKGVSDKGANDRILTRTARATFSYGVRQEIGYRLSYCVEIFMYSS